MVLPLLPSQSRLDRGAIPPTLNGRVRTSRQQYLDILQTTVPRRSL